MIQQAIAQVMGPMSDAGFSESSFYFGQAFDQVVAFASGKPINIVNPDVL